MNKSENDQGFVLVALLMMLAAFIGLHGAYSFITNSGLYYARSVKQSARGFDTAEAGANLRGRTFDALFSGYSRPSGTGPTGGLDGCLGASPGSGDYQCATYSIEGNRTAVTYVDELAGNPQDLIVPQAEPFQGAIGEEYRYTLTSVARNNADKTEGVIETEFRSRVMPVFQFLAFFEEDLELTTERTLTLDGAIHTNGDLYLVADSGDTLNLGGQITAAGTFYRGKKSKSDCSSYTGSVDVLDPNNYTSLPSCAVSGRTSVTDLNSWDDNIIQGFEAVTTPDVDGIDSFSSEDYWTNADLRLVLRLDGSELPIITTALSGVEVVNADGTTNTTLTNAIYNIANCPGLISTGGGPNYSIGTTGPSTVGSLLRLFREYYHDSTTNNYERVLEVDVRGLLNCLDNDNSIIGGRALDDTTDGGLVIFLAVDGPSSSNAHNNYAVRLRNASELQSSNPSAPKVEGLTLVTDQKMVIWGDYNSTNWTPTSLASDSMFLLSNNWTDSMSTQSLWWRMGNATTVDAAVLTGLQRTGSANGAAGQDQGEGTNQGGVLNIFSFNEWFKCSLFNPSCIPDFTFTGSIVSLGPPRRSSSPWQNTAYHVAPTRVWSYDERFNDPANLPPLTPDFVYLKKERFVKSSL